MSRMDPRFNAIVGLYQEMPGAPMPPKEDDATLWGVVGGNQHWAFCEAIIDFVEAAVRQVQITPEDERNTGFFTQLLNEANLLSPGEAFTLYGPKSITTHPDYARLHSMLHLHIFGEPEPGQADRWKFTIIKGKPASKAEDEF